MYDTYQLLSALSVEHIKSISANQENVYQSLTVCGTMNRRLRYAVRTKISNHGYPLTAFTKKRDSLSYLLREYY
jgi:hypothetical protein